MCLILTNEEGINPKILTARTNILCYKYLCTPQDNRNQFIYEKFKSNPKVHIEVESLKEVREHKEHAIPASFNYLTYDHLYIVNEGYHSRIKNERGYNNSLFIIPKGTKYIKGRENHMTISNKDNYVSENLIYIGKINWFNKLLAKFR